MLANVPLSKKNSERFSIKGDSISNWYFYFRLVLKKKCEITVPNIDFSLFFEDETIVKILSKIKPPLHDLNTLKFRIAFEIHTFKRHQVLGSH